MQRKSLALRLVKNLVILLTFIGPTISPKMSMKLSDNFELVFTNTSTKTLFPNETYCDFGAEKTGMVKINRASTVALLIV